MICFYLLIYYRFWDSSSPLFYLKYVGRTIPLFLSFLFFCNYIFIRIKLKLHIWLAWVNLQIFWSQKNFSKVNITHNKHKKPFSKVLLSRLVNFKIRCISSMKGVLFHRKTQGLNCFYKRFLSSISTVGQIHLIEWQLTF